MYPLTLVTLLWLPAAVGMASENACTNGSFEQLAPHGFPADWSPVGSVVEVSSDAHSGSRALRLLRKPDSGMPETGLNRAYGGVGKQGAMLDLLKGGIDFYYKAVSARAADLNVQVIAMNAEPLEETGEMRAAFTVPEQHIGDGRWHHARLKYDFSHNPEAKWVHIAARIVGTSGELLLDDISYVEQVGPVVQIDDTRIQEDAETPGRRCTLNVRIRNAGDVVAPNVVGTMAVPDGFATPAAEINIGDLAPDQIVRARWTLEGARTRGMAVDFSATCGDTVVESSHHFRPEMIIKNFGPKVPVAAVGKPASIECELTNSGSIILLNPKAQFELPTGEVVSQTKELPPGESMVLAADFVGSKQSPAMPVAVRAQADNLEGRLTAQGSVSVGSSIELPPPSGRLNAVTDGEYALLENEHLRLAFRRNEFGFGPGELSVATESGWKTVAWLPRLARLVCCDADGKPRRRAVFTSDPPRASSDQSAGLVFSWTAGDADGAVWRLHADFAVLPNAKSIKADYKLTCDKPRELLAFEGPMIHVLDRKEAILPGLEWLVDDEVSSGTLDIAEGHPHQERYVVHPNMITIPAVGVHSENGTVGLLWDVHQKWDGRRDRPSAVFASPDRLDNHRSHLMGLFLPAVPEFVEPNRRQASTPYRLAAGHELTLGSRIFADGRAADALAVVDEWFRLNQLPGPVPLPHGSHDAEIEFCMRGYLESLWVADEQKWWTSKGMLMMSEKGRPRTFVADLLLGEIASADADLSRACRQRADQVIALIGGQPRLDAQRFSGRQDLAFASPGPPARLLATREEDGSWRFDADHVGTGPFLGANYYELGPDRALEVGTCAQKASAILRYARISGDRTAYESMEKTLLLMESFDVPRAAQVWEVPVHTPDILAAADAVDAYIEAYRISGNQRWLQDAVTWARRGLPFVYLWEDPEKPFLVGGSIPVFGATWYQGSWFGKPVQWNGLRYANAILKLDEYDQSFPWRQVADLVIRSAIWQQDLEGPDVALWPDNIDAIDSAKCPWMFAPRQILRNILKLTGRDEDPATVILGQGETRYHLTATAKISDATVDDHALTFSLTYPEGEQGVVLVANTSEPSSVSLNGEPAARREDIEQGDQPGWRYDPANAYLAIRVTARQSAVRIEGVSPLAVCRIPWPVDEISFEFDKTSEGWTSANNIGPLSVSDGSLTGAVTGGDPYLVRGLINVSGDDCPVIHVRLRVTQGQGGQFFWTTKASPAFDEKKQIAFPLLADGDFHEYQLELSTHDLWAGHTITAIRIDPGNGAGAEFALDYVRAPRQQQ